MFESIIAAAVLNCLASNVYYEARGQSPAAMIAVTHVVLNRTQDEKYPDEVCDVIKQKDHKRNICQFSWVCTVKGAFSYKTKSETEAWNKSKEYAEVAYKLWKNGVDVTDGAQYYHATHVRPSWSKRMTMTTRIDDHLFYRKNTK